MELTGHLMQPVAVRDGRDPPVPVGARLILEWHIAQYEVRDATDELVGYRSYCERRIPKLHAIIEPGRIGAFCQRCASFGHLPKYR